MAGNLAPVTKSGDQPSFTFHAFHENRLPMTVRVRDMSQSSNGRIAFMSESRVTRGDNLLPPICSLNIALPDFTPGVWGSKTDDDDEECEKNETYNLSSRPLGLYHYSPLSVTDSITFRPVCTNAYTVFVFGKRL
jgi:UPA domain